MMKEFIMGVLAPPIFIVVGSIAASFILNITHTDTESKWFLYGMIFPMWAVAGLILTAVIFELGVK